MTSSADADRAAAAPAPPPASGGPATIRRRLASLAYEALLLAALLIVAGLALLPVVSESPSAFGRALDPPGSGERAIWFAWNLTVAACYFVWSWSGGRRTLPMKTWRLVLRTRDDRTVSPARALVRFAAASIGPAVAILASSVLAPLGYGRWALVALPLNFAWALWDPEHDFLHDRIAKTRLLHEPACRNETPGGA